jgi:murein DD-endopeptidase MepM/ murein hydrolase activator NlpD
MMQRTKTALILLALLAPLGCRSEPVREFLDNYTPHERYERRLRAGGLDQTALGGEWIAAAASALATPIAVDAPYREDSYLDARGATAVAYRISLRRGQHLIVAFEGGSVGTYRVFVDLFRAPRPSGDRPRHIASADSLGRSLEHLVRRDGDYLLRVQPELLLGGPYAITIEVEPSLRFPVAGHDTTAIQSWYGDPRDGGRREHHGLDIFARRGTPVVAAADGYIRSTRPNNLGGNVIWLRDGFQRTLYYAHLDRVAVHRGQRVAAGDTIGFVGNSGNARTTPTHLHFGVYARGPFDPYPALYEFPTGAAPFTGDAAVVGRLARLGGDRVAVRARPSPTATVVARLDRHTPLHVEAGTGSWYRVRMPDRTTGYVDASRAEALDEPIRQHRVVVAASLLANPDSSAAPIDWVAQDATVAVLGEYGGYALAQGAAGRLGWLALD